MINEARIRLRREDSENETDQQRTQAGAGPPARRSPRFARTGRLPKPPRGAATHAKWGSVGASSAREVAEAHQELIHRARRLAPLADCPDHQRLAAADVAGGEHLRH